MHRQIAHILLALILMVATTGITFSMHYCGGKLVSSSINSEAKTCCDGSGGCCENLTLHIGLEDDFESPSPVQHTESLELDLLHFIHFVYNSAWTTEESQTTLILQNESPPIALRSRLSLLQTYRC
jgi:hypothetical protein